MNARHEWRNEAGLVSRKIRLARNLGIASALTIAWYAGSVLANAQIQGAHVDPKTNVLYIDGLNFFGYGQHPYVELDGQPLMVNILGSSAGHVEAMLPKKLPPPL